MSAGRLRASMIGLLVAAAALSVVGNKSGERWLNALSLVLFGVAVALYLVWRRRISR